MLLRNKVFWTFTILIVIPLIVVGMLVHIIFSKAEVENVTVSTENSINQFIQSLDLMIEDASRISLSIFYDQQLINILRQYDNESTAYRNLSHANTFALFLSGVMYKKDTTFGVHVFTNNGQIFSHMDQYNIKSYLNLSSEGWFQKAKDERGLWIIYSEESPSYYLNNNEEMISLARIIRDPLDHKEVGLIKVDFSPEYLKKLTDRLFSEYWEITRNGEALFNTENSNLLKKCVKNRSWITDDHTGEEYLCITNHSSNTEIEVSNIIPKSYIYKEINNFDKTLVSLIIFLVILSLILSYYTSNHLMKPLENMKAQIIQMHRDASYDKIETVHGGEIEVLSGAYNEMFIEIEDLVEKVYQLQIRNAESEYKALQSKMDPHFLFNTLESINMKAITNGEFAISDMITELGKLFRYRLNNEEPLVKLAEELAFSNAYLSIMKKRMTENLVVDWGIDDSILHYKVPKYILQPLIENALTHGYEENGMELNIKIVQIREKIKITVTDTGVGISNTKLNEIYKKITSKSVYSSQTNKKSTSIALENISERLELIYGQGAKLLIDSEQGVGTKVTVLIPVGDRDNNEKGIISRG